jgi:hypothetical protein
MLSKIGVCQSAKQISGGEHGVLVLTLKCASSCLQRYPEYYNVIKEPIDLKTIAMRIQDNQYRSLDHLEKDMLLMCKNARTFNEPGSVIYKVG